MRLRLPKLSLLRGLHTKSGRNIPTVTERLREIREGTGGPLGSGPLSRSEIRARERRLQSLISELEGVEEPIDEAADADPSYQTPEPAPPGKFLDNGQLLDNGQPLVSPILVRDACRCPECVDPSDRQRNFSYADIPPDISYSSVSRIGKTAQTMVSWRNDAPPHYDGKSVVFDSDTIRSFKKSFRNPHWALYGLPQRLWDANSFSAESHRVEYNDYIHNDDVLAEALHLLWQDGLVLIDAVPASEESVSKIVSRIGPLMNTFYGSTWDVRSVPDAKNVAYTAKYLGFHMDLLYMNEPPAYQFLHSIHNESTGGDSLFADTFKAVDMLYAEDPQKFIDLMTYNIRYEYDNDGHFYSDAKPTIVKRSPHIPKRVSKNAQFPNVVSQVQGVHWSPPFVGNLHARHHYELVDLVSASKAFSNILEQPGMAIRGKLAPGTCVIFDNLRIVHARDAFDANSGRRWFRGAYLGRQDFISKASTLQHRMPANIEKDSWKWSPDRKYGTKILG